MRNAMQKSLGYEIEILPIRSHRGVWVLRQNSHLFSFIGACSLQRPLQHQTRTQSLFMCFWGELRMEDRLRRAGSHGKVARKIASYLPMRSCAPQPNYQSPLTPKFFSRVFLVKKWKTSRKLEWNSFVCFTVDEVNCRKPANNSGRGKRA